MPHAFAALPAEQMVHTAPGWLIECEAEAAPGGSLQQPNRPFILNGIEWAISGPVHSGEAWQPWCIAVIALLACFVAYMILLRCCVNNIAAYMTLRCPMTESKAEAALVDDLTAQKDWVALQEESVYAEKTLPTSIKETEKQRLRRAVSPLHHKATEKRVLIGVWRVLGSVRLQNLFVRSISVLNSTPSGSKPVGIHDRMGMKFASKFNGALVVQPQLLKLDACSNHLISSFVFPFLKSSIAPLAFTAISNGRRGRIGHGWALSHPCVSTLFWPADFAAVFKSRRRGLEHHRRQQASAL
eukprot:1149102-Pelagomonas_calceolata.AAC.8